MKTLAITLISLTFLWSSACSAQKTRKGKDSTQRIAAVVNDDVISVYDLDARIKLAALNQRLRVTPKVRKRLSKEVLKQLIGERLKIQEAKRLGIKVTAKEITQTLVDIEKRNRMPRGRLLAILRKRGINPRSLVNQIRAGIAWGKVIGRRIRPTVRISSNEVDDVLQRIAANKNLFQYTISEIYLPVDSPGLDESVRRSAERLITQIRRGARFSDLARQYSRSNTAGVGGDVGTVREGQLDPRLEIAIKKMHSGQIMGPVRTATGYYIIYLRDRRTAAKGNPDTNIISLAQAAFRFRPGSSAAARRRIRDQARKIAQDARTCAVFMKKSKAAKAASARIQPRVDIRQLSPPTRRAIKGLKPGQPAKPIILRDGIIIYMKCAKPKGGLPARRAVQASILRQKLNVRVQRYLLDLRRAAHVEIRV